MQSSDLQCDGVQRRVSTLLALLVHSPVLMESGSLARGQEALLAAWSTPVVGLLMEGHGTPGPSGGPRWSICVTAEVVDIIVGLRVSSRPSNSRGSNKPHKFMHEEFQTSATLSSSSTVARPAAAIKALAPTTRSLGTARS